MTIPELYYDRFVSYVEADDYDGCIRLLSYAAVEEEDEIVRVRKPMPHECRPTAITAKTAPEPANLSAAVDSACKFDPFVERNWGRPYVWVQIPKVGNVTVPEDYYDQFVGHVSAEPSDFTSACNVLSRGGGHGHGCHDQPDRSRSGHAVTTRRGSFSRARRVRRGPCRRR